MTAISVATVLAFLFGALLMLHICVNVTDETPNDWSEPGRAKAWFWCILFGLVVALVVYSALSAKP